MASPVWCIDTSSLVIIRTQFSKEQRQTILAGLSALVAAGRMRFPKQLITELERYLGPDNPALTWATTEQGTATAIPPSPEDIETVLAEVPEVIDADKEGVEEADPYVLAMAYRILLDGDDARIVTEEFKTTVEKMPLGSAAGYLRIPSVSLRTMLKFEGILEY
jgi:hypothetical protein